MFGLETEKGSLIGTKFEFEKFTEFDADFEESDEVWKLCQEFEFGGNFDTGGGLGTEEEGG